MKPTYLCYNVVCIALLVTSVFCHNASNIRKKKIKICARHCYHTQDCKWGDCCVRRDRRNVCRHRPRYGGSCTNTSIHGIYKEYCDCLPMQGTCVNNKCM
uniref:Putative secreted peptide n=1 Tax=Rhipicephalus pulchellus TaxID=72859 RepID=L7MCB2_RHIPC